MAIKVNIKNSFIVSSVVFSLCCLLLVVFGTFYFSNKGFELSDETYYLYFSYHHNPETFIVSNFGLLNDFFCFGKPTLIHLRIAKLVYQSLAVLFFCYGMFKFFDFKKYQISKRTRLFVVITALMLSYVNYDYLPMTLSYNGWTFILSLACFGVFFLELILPLKWISLIYSVIIGLLIGCLLLVKLPAGIILGFFYFLLNVFVIRKRFFQKLFFVLIGLLLSYLIFLNDFAYLENIVNTYYVTLFEVKHADANSYLQQMKDFWNLCIEKNYVLGELIFFLVAVFLKKTNLVYKTIFSYFLVAFNLGLCFLFIKGNGEVLYNDFLAGTLFTISAGLYLYLFKEDRLNKSNYDTYWLSALLLISPFCLMIGTNNDFYYTVSHTLLFAVMALFLLMASGKVLQVEYLALKSAFVCVFILGILYYGAVKSPYRQTDLTKKQYTLHFSGAIDGVDESYEKYIDFHVLSNLTKKINTTNKPIVTFFNHFGLYYLANVAIFPESQISDGEKYVYINDYMLKRYKFNDRFKLIVIPETVENGMEMKHLFEKYGVRLNDNYKLMCYYQFLSTGEKVFFYNHV